MVWITIIWLPLAILIGLQVGFLAYHSEDILFWQRVVIALDLCILAIFWPIIRATNGNWFNWVKHATGLAWISHRLKRLSSAKNEDTTHALTSLEQQNNNISGRPMLEGMFSLFTVTSILIFSNGIAVLPDSTQEKEVTRALACMNLDHWLIEKPRVKINSVQKEKSLCVPVSEIKDGERYSRLTEYISDKRYFIDDKGREQTKDGIFNRSLILREQLLIANTLTAEDEADIAHEDEAIRTAALKKVNKLVLSGRDFCYADFSYARLPRVDFYGADGQAADLRDANFTEATLTKASMEKVKLQGANLYKVELQGANLSEAKLQGAELYGTELQGADLTMSKLTLSDITNVKFGKLTQQELSTLLEDLSERIDDAQLLDRLTTRLSKAVQKPVTLIEAYGNEIWAKKPNDVVHALLYGFGNQLYAATDETDYQNHLATHLLNSACENKWIAAGIIHNRLDRFFFIVNVSLTTEIAQSLLDLKNQKNQSGKLACPALSEIDNSTLKLLKDIAAKEPNPRIPATF